MKNRIDFKISLPIYGKLKHLKDKSYYDHNYYVLPTYGDWIGYGDENNNILYEKYSESDNCYTYAFGRFENDEFIKVLEYTADDSVLEDVELESEVQE